MRAIAITPGTGDVRLVNRPEPQLTSDEEVKLQVLQVGICGTDREEAGGGRALAATGGEDLVIGHEMVGRVVEVGRAVTRVRTGDYAVFTVRRGCGQCLPCAMNRSDMCRTGNYRERGIWGLDGYQTEYVVDSEHYVVQVPRELGLLGVLAEPMSIAEKALDEGLRLQQARLPAEQATPDWLRNRRCLVAGLGPVGLLAALVLRLRGAEVFGLDIVPAETSRPGWLKAIGGTYIDGREIPANKVADSVGPMELIFEGAGIATLEFNLLDALALNGVYLLTGIPGGNPMIQIPGADLIRRMVLGNQLLLGSVNASRGHFQMAVDDLAHARLIWGEHLEGLITHRYSCDDLSVLARHPPEEIKGVFGWTVN